MKHLKRLNDAWKPFHDDDFYGEERFKSEPNGKIIKNLKVGNSYTCKRTYKGNRFTKGEKYELLEINGDDVVMRYYRNGDKDIPVRYRMSNTSFRQFFEISKNEPGEKEEIGLFDEDDWEKDIIEPVYIYTIATGRDYDIVGYVVAEDEDRAKLKAREMGMVPRELFRFLRADRLENVQATRRRKVQDVQNNQRILNYLDSAIRDLEKNENK